MYSKTILIPCTSISPCSFADPTAQSTTTARQGSGKKNQTRFGDEPICVEPMTIPVEVRGLSP